MMIVGFVCLVLNSLYLALRPDASVFYFANVVLHLVLGVALAVGGARRLRRSSWPQLPLLLQLSVPPLLVAAFTGLALMLLGSTRPYRLLLHAHITSAVLGALPVLAYLLRAFWPQGVARWRGGLASVGVATAAALLSTAAVLPRPGAAHHGHIANPPGPPASMDGEGAGPQSLFFPSSSETRDGAPIPADFFLTSELCGRCHKDIYEQWRSSAHHFSSFNNQWYRKSVEYMQDLVGTRPSRWCAGCHDHAVFFSGLFDRPIKEQIDTPAAHAGLGCVSCHSIVHVKSTMGQGDFVIEYPPLHELATSENPWLTWAHDYLLELAPQPHRDTFLKPFHREQTAEFCSVCHKVHLDVPVNAYRWMRGFNEYDNWQASGVSGQGARSFYYPPQPRTCPDCHMPLVASDDPAAKNGRIRSHNFPGANTALPYVNRDAEQLQLTQAFLRAGQVSVDLFGLVRGAPLATRARPSAAAGEPRLASTFAQGEETASFGAAPGVVSAPGELVAPLGDGVARVRRGESLRVEVVVRTRNVGHFFPGGTVDAYDVWVELLARDDRGHTLLHSGRVADDGAGPVESGAHFYRSLMLDEHGGPINKRNAWAARSLAYVRLIPPGAADTVHYRLEIPEDCGERITLRARLLHRKFAWWHTQWAYAGVRDPEQPDYSVGPGHDDGRWVFNGDTSRVSGRIKQIPTLPITVMAEAEASLEVVGADDALEPGTPVADTSVRGRWNDYGIGLLLQGDIKGAEAAFLAVTRIDPEYPDGWVNVARARLAEGNLPGADAVLQRALALDPQLARTHFFQAQLLKARGEYDEALIHLRAAARQYPRDRVVLNQIGRILFLKRRYRDAVETFERVLEIDPEDLQAHYNLMLCWRGLGATEQARREQVLYQRFKADESAQAITGPYRRLHPDDNNERQPVHEHGSAPVGASRGKETY